MNKMPRLLLLVFLALSIGCQQAQPPGGAPGPVSSGLAELREEGDRLAERGEYAAAAVRYQTVLNRDPDDLSLRFRLGSVLSHVVGRQAETVETFRGVVERGWAESPEVRVARRWLVSAGVLAAPVAFASAASPEGETATPGVASPQAGAPAASTVGGRVKGRTEARAGIRQVILALAGDDDGNLEIAFSRTLRPGEAFEFGHVPPGNYRLTAEDPATESQVWNVPVTVAPGKDLVVELK